MPAEDPKMSLRKILESAPRVQPEIVDLALGKIVEAVRQFKVSAQEVADNTHRVSPTPADIKIMLEHLEKHIGRSLDAYRELPMAIRDYIKECSSLHPNNIVTNLITIMDGTTFVRAEFEGRPTVERRLNRHIFAVQIAKILKNDLGIKLSKTVMSETVNGRRNGAMFDRTLKAAFALAGIRSVKTKPLLTKAIETINSSEKILN